MILIDKVRVQNFRSLKNFEIDLERLTVLAGMNNSGKTTFLRSLNLVFGANKFQPTRDDLFIDSDGNQPDKYFNIDIRIIPVDENDFRKAEFNAEWLSVFGNEIRVDEDGDFFAVRYKVRFAGRGDRYKSSIYTISDWNSVTENEDDALGVTIGEAINLYYIDAQRDLSHDVKLRHSYFGKLASQVNDSFDEASANKIIEEIKKLNETAIDKSEVLKHLQTRLAKLNSTSGNEDGGVSISPFSTNVRDLHKGMKVNYQDGKSDKFSLEYHGMGTRSWASLLSFKAYTSWEIASKRSQGEAYFPILALEEPEAHLHPNAQRTLYKQLAEVGGQKIVSTHSPYVVAQADLEQLRHLHKPEDCCRASRFEFTEPEELRIGELLKEIEDVGGAEINRKNRPIIEQLKNSKRGKLTKEDKRKIKREVINSRGEILFAKMLILFEGETEEQAIPLLFKEYFDGQDAFDFGISLVGVGGKSNYGSFLKLAKYLDIPFYILSDGDGDTEQEVIAQVLNEYDDYEDRIFVFDTYDFEEYLISDSFQAVLISAINKCRGSNYFPEDYCREQNGQKRKGGEVKVYLKDDDTIDESSIDQALLDCLHSSKTEFAPYIASEILMTRDDNDQCRLPTKVVELFAEVKTKIVIG